MLRYTAVSIKHHINWFAETLALSEIDVKHSEWNTDTKYNTTYLSYNIFIYID